VLPAQIQQEAGNIDESQLYASTKQVNQFFRRFNGEEDHKGKRYYKNDPDYRSVNLRKNYLAMLFDKENSNISSDLKKKFVTEITDKRNPQFLKFHDAEWFAEANAVFMRGDKEENVILYFKIQQQGQGFAWVLDRVSSDSYKVYFQKNKDAESNFLHPMSHELDFMNLHKSFRNNNGVDYTSKEFQADHLSIFLYELGSKKLSFKTVQEVKFHFFQCDGWYFQITEYNRSGYNTGWLISDLTEIKTEEIPALKALIYDEL
jgi:hypothetical protein